MYLVLEYACGGELYAQLQKHGKFDEATSAKVYLVLFTVQILSILILYVSYTIIVNFTL